MQNCALNNQSYSGSQKKNLIGYKGRRKCDDLFSRMKATRKAESHMQPGVDAAGRQSIGLWSHNKYF